MLIDKVVQLHVHKLAVRYSQNNRVILAVRICCYIKVVFGLYFCSFCPGVVHLHPAPVFMQFMDDVDDSAVSYIGAVFLERDPENKHM